MAEVCHCAGACRWQNLSVNTRVHWVRHGVVTASVVGLLISSAHGDEAIGGLKTIKDLVADAHVGVEYITSAQLKSSIAANPRLVLLDVRTKVEFDGGHLKGAAWVERGVAEFVMVRQLPDPDAEIVVYCKVGHRTGLVVKALKNAGYRHVRGLEGGFEEWAQQGNSVYNYLGEFKVVTLIKRDAATPVVDFYEAKR